MIALSGTGECENNPECGYLNGELDVGVAVAEARDVSHLGRLQLQ